MINWERYFNLFKKLSLQSKDLTGKHALITGGNEGVGYNVAVHLAKMNCKVTIASRNEARSAQAVEKIKHLTGNRNVSYEVIDLGSFESVKDFTESFIQNNFKLDYLVNNAGGVFHKFSRTKDGLEKTLEVNHLSPLLLTLGLLPIIKKSEDSRIIMTTSDIHLDTTLNLPQDLEANEERHVGMIAYSKSKLMTVLIAKQLAKKLSPLGILVCSVHPGFVKTTIGKQDLPDTFGFGLFDLFFRTLQFFFGRSGEQGGISTAYTVVSNDILPGEYYDSCKLSYSNPQASDLKLQEQLWNESLKLIEVDETKAIN